MTLRHLTNGYEISESIIILFNEVCTEPGKKTLANHAVKLPLVIDAYKLKDTANYHERGLFLCVLPRKTMSLKGENILLENSERKKKTV